MIPKIIHQTWKNNDIPPHNIFCVESWKTLNPDYEYKFWSDEDIINFVKEEYPQFVDIVNNFKLGIIKADFFRLLVLYHFGGVYVDIDFECLKPIKDWPLDENKINVATEPVEHNQLHGISNFIICNALIASPPKKEIILDFIKNANLVNYNSPFEVLFSYGPLAWTSWYKTSLLQQHLHFLDSKQFYPLPDISNLDILYEKTTKQNYINLIKNRNYNAYAVHYWDHSNYDRDNILKLYSKPEKIKYFNVLGERCSGTNFLEELISVNFNLSLSLKKSKHFFGADTNYRNDTLYVGIVRNITDWINSLYKTPHHISMSVRKNKDTFLNNEFYSLHGDWENFTMDESKLQEIIGSHNFLTQKRYKNIFELRSVKCNYLLKVLPTLASHYILIRYEDIQQHSLKFLNHIKTTFNLETSKDYPREIPYKVYPGSNGPKSGNSLNIKSNMMMRKLTDYNKHIKVINTKPIFFSPYEIFTHSNIDKEIEKKLSYIK